VIAAIESVLSDRSRDLAHNHSQLMAAVADGDTGVVGAVRAPLIDISDHRAG